MFRIFSAIIQRGPNGMLARQSGLMWCATLRVSGSKATCRAPRADSRNQRKGKEGEAIDTPPLAKHYRRDLVLAEGPTAGAASKTLF